jgi:predicted AAA+ superfamily ATPase
LHSLLGARGRDELLGHPKLGASWEGFALEQVLHAAGAAKVHYWGTHAGAELDLMLFRGGQRYGIEFKHADAPAMTRSLHIALADLKLQRAWVVYPGKESYPVHEKVQVCPLPELLDQLAALALSP